jgi:Ca2+-binding RTX toxin-like protein
MGIQLDTYYANLKTVEEEFERQETRLEVAEKALNTLSTIVSKLDDASKDAKKIDEFIDDMRSVSKVLKLFGPTKAVGTTLDRVLDKIADRTEDIKDTLARYSTEIKVFSAAISTAKRAVDGLQIKVSNDLGDIASIEASLLDLKEAIDEDPAALSPEAEAALVDMETLFAELNTRFPTEALEEMDASVAALETSLNSYNNLGSNVAKFQQGIGEVSDKLAFIADPLGVVLDALSPLMWVLEKAESVVDKVVSPVVDPIMENLGIDNFLNQFERSFASLLPDLNLLGALNDVPNKFAGIFGSSPSFDQPMVTRVETAYGNRLDPLPLDPKQALIARLLGEASFIGPVLADGTNQTDVLLGRNFLPFINSDLDGMDGRDVLSAGFGADTLIGGPGDDVLINAGGDDEIDGKAGFDTLYTYAPLSSFVWEVTEETRDGTLVDVLRLSHVGGLFGNFGDDRVINVESFVFGASVYTFNQLATAIRVNYAVNNQATGGTADDLLLGGERADLIRGNGGNDVLIGGLGLDTLDGGSGIDAVDYGGQNTTGVNINIGDLTRLGSLQDDIRNVENVMGSVGDDVIAGSDVANFLNGNRGDDTIAGFAGNDVIVTGKGQDFATGDIGNDTISSTYGMDRLLAGDGFDTYTINRDDNAGDLLFYDIGTDVLDGGISASQFAPLTRLTDGNIRFDRLRTEQTLRDGIQTTVITKYDANGRSLGFDTARSSGINIVGTRGNDAFELSEHFALFDGKGGDDLFLGTSVNLRDRIPDGEPLPEGLRAFGGDGNDRFVTRTMEESFVGGAGNDRLEMVIAPDAPSSLTEQVEDRQISFFFGGSAPTDFGRIVETTDPTTGQSIFTPADITGFDQSMLVDTGHDVIDLSDAQKYWLIDTESGLLSSRDFIGRGGLNARDTVDNRLRFYGVEEFIGSSLNDWLILGDKDIVFRGGDGVDRIIPGLGGGSGNTLAFGGDGDDVFHTGLGVDTLYGDGGNDVLRNGGNTLSADGAHELMDGGTGQDYLRIGGSSGYTGTLTDLRGGAGRDTAEFFLTASDVLSVDLSTGRYVLNGRTAEFRDLESVLVREARTTVLGSVAGDAIQTGDQNDTIRGEAGNDIINAGNGDDSVSGGDGNDVINPGHGSATVDGGAGEDALQLNSKFQWSETEGLNFADTDARGMGWLIDLSRNQISSTSGAITYGNIERFIGGWGRDTLIGSSGDDFLDGHRGNDGIVADAGHDTLIGGRDDDTLDGGAGDDILAPGTGLDTINGGDGFDLLQFGSSLQDLTVSSALGLASGIETEQIESPPGSGNIITFRYASFDRFSNIEQIALSNQADDAEGGAGQDRISGLLGDDTISGLGGDDTISGGEGNDLLAGDGPTRLPDLMLLNQALSTSYLGISSFTAMPTAALTVEMLVRAAPIFRPYTLMSYGVQGSTNEFTIITSNDHSTLRLLINGAVIDTTVLTSELYDGALHRLSVTWQSHSGSLSIYIDGHQAWSESGIAAASNPITSGGVLIFGQDQDGSTPGGGFDPRQAYHGAIGDIRLFNDIRSAEEIRLNTLRPLDPLPDGDASLSAEWRFDRDTAGGQSGIPALLTLSGLGTVVGHTDIEGSAGNDLLTPGTGSDTVLGGGGEDTVSYEDLDQAIALSLISQTTFGTGFTDELESIEHARGTQASDLLTGSAGDNHLIGDNGDDTLRGGSGDDTLEGGPGNDLIEGGSGNDRAVIDDMFANTSSALAANGAVYLAWQGGITIVDQDVESIEFSDTVVSHASVRAAPTHSAVQGTSAGDGLQGTGASEFLFGFGGGDWITPGGGNDTIDGAEGRDMLSFVNLSSRSGDAPLGYLMDIDMQAGTAVSVDRGEHNRFINIERLTGTIFADRFLGSDGDDELRGLGGYDWFNATPGQDTIDGGTGLDMISFLNWRSDASNVVVDVFSSSGLPPTGAQTSGVVVDLANPANNTNLAAGLTISGVERVTGSSRQDVFYGDSGQNDFRGLGDYDWFVSSTGGRERYFGGDGLDTVTYFNAASGVVANLRNGAQVNGRETGYGTGGDAARDLFFEIENLVGSRFNDSLTGSSERNQLNGLEGDDMLFGYGGVDYLMGGAGNDTINGGAGSDYALFTGDSNEYRLIRSGNTVTVSGTDGTDRLIDVEYFRFEDTDISIWSL